MLDPVPGASGQSIRTSSRRVKGRKTVVFTVDFQSRDQNGGALAQVKTAVVDFAVGTTDSGDRWGFQRSQSVHYGALRARSRLTTVSCKDSSMGVSSMDLSRELSSMKSFQNSKASKDSKSSKSSSSTQQFTCGQLQTFQ